MKTTRRIFLKQSGLAMTAIGLAPAFGSTFLRNTAFASQELAEPFVPDQNTLFLAHFDKNMQEADYAAGWNRFAGGGAGLIEGYYGKAANLRGLQFDPNFLQTHDSYIPRFQYWGFWPIGNVDYYQGTFEFWFQTSPPDMKQNTLRNNLFFSSFAKNVMQDGKIRSLSAQISPSAFYYSWPFLNNDIWSGGVQFKSVKGFNRELAPDEWHHYAMSWSPGEMVISIDGRPLATHDMTDKIGLALSAYTHRDFAMNGVVMDELRISNIVRYGPEFEPNWRDGKRSDYAFTGIPGIKRYPPKTEIALLPVVLSAPVKKQAISFPAGVFSIAFDKTTGYLTSLEAHHKIADRGGNGVLLWRGVDRTPLSIPRGENFRSNKNSLSFEQAYGDELRVANHLTPHAGGVKWQVTFSNSTDKELWLEAMLSLPLPLSGVDQYFDGSATHSNLKFARRRDAYVSTLPFAAAADQSMSIGAGIDPHIPLSVMVSEWIPENTTGTLRQGTRVVLDPKGHHSLTFYLVSDDSADFGTTNALARYHGLFSDLYKFRPDVPIYSYLPTGQDFIYMPYPDFSRQCYVGNTWGFGPGHTKGDEYGSAKYWDNPKYYGDPSYEHAQRMEKLWLTPERLHRLITLYYRRNFDNAYSLRRSHYVPNLTATFIARDLWPGYDPVGDPLVAAQYYMPTNLIVNEFHTPLGRFFKDETRKYSEQMAPYSPGFINDMCHISPYRHTDEIARQSPGRAFSRDRGTYLVGAVGHQDRYEMINNQITNGHRSSIWSDAGLVSYTLGAYSSALAIEGGARLIYLTGPNEGITGARNLIGEKPIAVLNSIGDDWIGKVFLPTDFTPKTLRDYYRYSNAQIMLFSIKNGVYLDPVYLIGNQSMMELNPILVESCALGRQLIAGARVNEPLWVRRGGENVQSFFVIGNEEPTAQTSDLTLLHRYFEGAPILGAYFGGDVKHQVNIQSTVVPDVSVAPRSAQAFKTLALLKSSQPAQVHSSFSGDGLTMRSTLQITCKAATQLELSSFAPVYEIARITINNQSLPSTQTLSLPAGAVTVEVEYRTHALQFASDDWDVVDLIKNGQTNFCLIADKGFEYIDPADPQNKTGTGAFEFGYEHGTAMMLNQFIRQYDEEDGVLGDMKAASLGDVPPENFAGWKIFLQINSKLKDGQMRIEPDSRSIFIEGQTRGEQRRAMVVLLRLLDRKYPHVGRHTPLVGPGALWNVGKKEPWARWNYEKDTAEFFANFSDLQWLDKPILDAEHEPLYANNNMDFAGKYTLHFSPYIFEPTYADNFVYGYSGPAADPVTFPHVT